MKVNHVAIVNDWDLYEVFENAEILILGSFNPYNLNGDNADYFPFFAIASINCCCVYATITCNIMFF